MDTVVQKSTELGVRRITPIITDFSVVKLDSDRAAKRHEHWRRISLSACEQCGRNRLPEIDVPQTLNGWLEGVQHDGTTRIMLDPRGGESIAALSAPNAGVELLVGPEGGLSPAEREQCRKADFAPVSLGPRALRTETAALAGVAVLQALWGDLG
jgi:16S rRNA (uracil1498-N3)-methyltransferase